MEADNLDNTADGGGGGGEPETKPVTPNDKVDEMEESAAKAKCDPVSEPQHLEKNESTGESEIKYKQSPTKYEVTPELTLVVIGDTKSIEIGSKNILLDHDKQVHVGKFSSRLYDLCGRHISVINMLGLQNIDTDTFPLNKEIHAFLLLLTNGLHNSHYSSGLQWLEKAFGKESLSYLMTVVTHESDEKCESALTDLKANSSFDEKRYHTCTRSMMDETEIIALVEKIDVMVSENDPHCYSRLMCDEKKEQKENLDHESQEEEWFDSSEFQQNQTVEELEDSAAETEVKCDPLNEPGRVEHSEKNDDNTTMKGKPEIKSEPTTKEKVDEPEDSAAETEAKCDPLNEPGRVEHSEKNDDNTTGEGESDIKSEPSTTKEKVDEPEDSAAETEAKCDPLNEPGRVEHSEKNDDNTTGEGESDIKSEPSTTEEKVDEPEDSAAETEAKCELLNEPGRVEHSEKNDDNTTGEGESDIKSEPSTTEEKVDEPEDSAAETEAKCELLNEPGRVEHSEKNDDNTTGEGESDIKSEPSTTEEKVDEPEGSAAETEAKCELLNEPGRVEHSEKNDDNTTGEGESDIKSEPSTTEEKVDEPEDSAAETEAKCELLNEPGRVEHSEKNDDNTTGEGESDIKSEPSTTEEKVDEPEDSAAETEAKCELLNEPGRVEHSEKNDDNTTGEGESDIKSEPSTTEEKVDEPEDSAAETEAKCDPLNEPGHVEHSEKNDDNTTGEGESDIKSEPSTTEEKVDEPEDSAAETEAKCDPLDEPGRVEHSEKNDDNTTMEVKSEVKPEPSTTKEKDMDVGEDKDMQSVKISEEINKKKEHQRETETLFGRLHLQDKHQQKLTPADFLKIGPPLKQEDDTCEKDLAHTFLQRLMMLDYRARYIPVRQDSPEVSQSNPAPVCDNVETDDSDLDALFSASVESDRSKQKHVHPMDVQMAVFHCSDSFLKQNMITKLSQCQYALPLLVPDPITMDVECPLWTFRQIKKTWKITQNEDDSNIVTMKSMPICKAETPMVSFFRLGSLSLSKSQLMNTLINDRHNTFFHRNCSGSTKSRHLMDGVVEIAWYCPNGKPNDAFTDCVAFCNLHGDALLIEKQRDILTEKSSVNVVLVPTLEKGHKSTTVISKYLKSPKPLIILIADNNCGTVQIKEGKYKLGLKDKSQSDVSKELKRIMRNILSGSHASFQLETMADVSGIKVDENDPVCQNGKSAAMKIVKLFQGMDVSEIKDTFLPCQGQLWHEWSRINKELYHLKGNIEMEKSEKEKKLMTIRKNQQEASCSELTELFNESLSSLNSIDKEYFVKWIQILIDALSTDDLSSILQSYDKKWSEVLTLKKKHDKPDQLKSKQTELKQISAKLQSATFGLEHIFREMGQIYEAHTSLQKQTKRGQTDWVKYPELAAELMISGHPMELMDGDAGHVPLTWISSLLDEVIKKLGDKKVFVLSVLGVQSSGKSTMLNAMFGLQFAVSAGRCTKGAFMQLIKVSEEIKTNCRCDYVLVVDTEGLRALELAGNTSLHHDNELATFVVGLGNMTLINIFGENPADMQDVLQIVVQAFMRMKKVKLSPSCVFVHQNVTDVAGTEKNMDGKRRLQEKLDEMAQLAAKEEVCDAKCFSDVIAFDVQKDVKYFAQLWEGSPPMAPPNPGYSESIQELKNFILSKASQSAGITLSQFKSKIHDLWNALLNENFVFSFKNTLEIAVYRKLEVQYGNWTWTLRSNMLTIENQLHTNIENGLDKVELSYLYEEMSKTYEEIKKAMRGYFDDKRDKEMLVQWKGRFQNKIKEFHDEQVTGVKRKLDEVILQKSACKKLDDKKPEFENKLLQKSKELAHQLKDKAKDEEELKKQFNSVWSGWVREITGDTKPIEDINLEEDQSTILQDHGFEWSLIAESKDRGSYKKISEVGNFSVYVTLTKHEELSDTNQHPQDDKRENENTGIQKVWGYVKTFWRFGSKQQNEKHTSSSSLSCEEQQLIRSLINNVEQQTKAIIKNKPVATRGYSPTYLHEVAKNVKDKVTEFESQREYALKKEFIVDLLLYVLEKAGSWLSESHKKFKMKNDALTYLESKKEQYSNIFRSFCKGNSSAVVLGELICEKLKSSTVEAVCNKTAIDLAGEMRCRCPLFSGNRLNLEKHVLKSLAEKEDFKGFITYIQRPRQQVETFIKEEVKKYIFTENKDKAQNILKKNVEGIKQRVSRALFTATDEVKTQRGNIKMWVDKFSSSLRDELTFDTIYCQNFKDINKFDFLKEVIEKDLKCIMKEISSLSLDKMNEFRLQPDQILIDQLCNCCWETCPFCAAVCTNTIENHLADNKHSVPFHRPSGIEGWHIRNTDELVIDFCTTQVASDKRFYLRHDSDETCPYKEYQKAGGKYASWEITPDGSKLTYWKWFVCTFQTQLEEHYKLKFHRRGEIPPEWRNYSKQEAIKSLDEIIKSL